MRTVSGVALACIASGMFNAAIAMQALEARTVPHEFALRISLLGKLVRRRRWLAGAALAVLAFIAQTCALLLAPLTAVQPADGAGLLLLLYLGYRHMGERVRRQELLAVASIVAGIVGLTIAAPRREVTHVEASDVLLPLAAVGVAALLPYLARRWRGSHSRLVMLGAGFAFALSAFATKLVADALARNAWAWLVLVLVLAVVGGMLGTLSEQSALQQRQATQVAPIIFVIELLVPVLLAVTVVGEDWSTSRAWIALCLALVTIGVVVLGRTPTIAQLIAAGTAGDEVTAGTR
jgi:drug/metabolite transporter (DMT)-like permease